MWPLDDEVGECDDDDDYDDGDDGGVCLQNIGGGASGLLRPGWSRPAETGAVQRKTEPKR